MPNYIAFDIETTLIGKDNIIPDLICSSFYELGEDSKPWVEHWSPKEEHQATVGALYDSENHIILHNASFDLSVLAKFDWTLLPILWQAVDEGRVHDTMIREMLLNLTLSGSIDIIEQYGLKVNVRYSLAELVLKYLQIDLSEEKEAEDSARMNYEMVRHKPLEEWPEGFIEYAEKDAKYTGLIFLEQEHRREECIKSTGYDPFKKEPFVIATALALQFMTAQGNRLDIERVKKVSEEFLTLYNNPDLVWPLVHSKYIHCYQLAHPETKSTKLIEEAKEAWETETEKIKKSYKETGLVIPAVPAAPFANGAKAHLPECEGHNDHPDYKKGQSIKLCMCPPKLKKPQPEKGSDINLHQYVWDIARHNPDIQVWVSDGFKQKLKEADMDVPHPLPRDLIEENEQVPFIKFTEGEKPSRLTLKVNKEWLATYASFDPVLAIYDERHKIQKIVSSYLPCLYWADGYDTACPLIMEGASDKFSGKYPAERVHACFAPLKETGRTSSYASKKGRGNNATVTYPSWNIQQVDPRIRQCVIPEEGNVLVSVDYSALELCTAAQISHDLLGYEGVLMNLINEGIDTHTYLGAQIAVALDPEFTSAWGLCEDDPMKSYTLLKEVAKNKEACDSPVFHSIFEDCYLGKDWSGHKVTWDDCLMSLYYKHFRTFGKPTGLGFWGGLGEATFIALSKASYGISVDMPTATILRNIWRKYIPEGQEYLSYVNKHMVDPHAEPELVEEANGSMWKRNFYCYDTPLGMHRAKCSYTAAANGCALQSPAAEGALGGIIEIMKSCTVGELAGYVFPSAFIHDEILFEAINDEGLTDRVEQIQRIMERNMEKITPNVKSRTEAAVMNRWSKMAEEVRDENNKLVPWESKEENKV